MKFNCRQKLKSDILLFFVIILFALCISMGIILYGSNVENYSFSAENVYEVKAFTENEVTFVNTDNLINDNISDNRINDNVSKYKTSESNNHLITKKERSGFKFFIIPNSIGLQTILLIVFLIFLSFRFLFLPDDWTLVNQKVRLDD